MWSVHHGVAGPLLQRERRRVVACLAATSGVSSTSLGIVSRRWRHVSLGRRTVLHCLTLANAAWLVVSISLALLPPAYQKMLQKCRDGHTSLELCNSCCVRALKQALEGALRRHVAQGVVAGPQAKHALSVSGP